MSRERVHAAWRAAERAVEWLDRLDPVQRADVDALIAVADAACACGGDHYCETEVAIAREAARVLVREHHLADFVYEVRQRAAEGDQPFEGNSWEHPKVVSFANAAAALRIFATGGPRATEPAPEDRRRPAPTGGFDLSPEAAHALATAVPCPGCGCVLGTHLPECTHGA